MLLKIYLVSSDLIIMLNFTVYAKEKAVLNL